MGSRVEDSNAPPTGDSVALATDHLAKLLEGRASPKAMRAKAQRSDAGFLKSFEGGATTFFFKGINGRWKDVLSAEELELYEQKVTEVLTPEARDWLENGRGTKAFPF